MYLDTSTGNKIYSANDIVNFSLCPHLTYLCLIDMETPLEKTPPGEAVQSAIDKGLRLEREILEQIELQGKSVFDVSKIKGGKEEKSLATIDAMRSGVDYIYQGVLKNNNLIGHPDFIKKSDNQSALGSHSYEIIDIKLAKNMKPKFVIQLCFYNDLLLKIQKADPAHTYIWSPGRKKTVFRVGDYIYYFRSLLGRFLEFVEDETTTEPYPCDHCELCRFSGICEKYWMEKDHLSRVASITRNQVKKLRQSGIDTMRKLATHKGSVKKIAAEALDKLKKQAELQLKKEDSGVNSYCLRSQEFLEKGLCILPPQNPGDIFFDIEGYPFFGERSLEYLFGIVYMENGKEEFRPFWAHNYKEEKAAFQDLVDFFTQRQQDYPKSHIYHYNHYETTALKRLMSVYGTREGQVDNLLRTGAFVDLYRILRNSLIISEPRYSLKNVEVFYSCKRGGAVTTSEDSIIEYEKYMKTGDQAILDEICRYNEIDCISTARLFDWLHEIKLKDGIQSISSQTSEAKDPEEEIESITEAISAWMKENPDIQQETERIATLLCHFPQFYRREKKPVWWSIFDKNEQTSDDLLEDPECLARISVNSYRSDGKKIIYECSFPEQEFKFIEGHSYTLAGSLETAGKIEDCDLEKQELSLSRSVRKSDLPPIFDLIPDWPIQTVAKEDALNDFTVDTFIHISENDTLQYKAGFEILTRSVPDIDGVIYGDSIVTGGNDIIDEICQVCGNLNDSFLFIQGPPGSGKTYTGSHIIANLLQNGKKVAVSSNAHKAINNLLQAVEERLMERNITNICGFKKNSDDRHQLNGKIIIDEKSNDKIPFNVDILGATGWTLCREEYRGHFDYLFIDEAGQIALADCLAMSTCARNIILLGDQMQLGHPSGAAHPDESGDTLLDYLLQGEPVVPPERGVFLHNTWRMHPDVCCFISDAIYNSQLKSVPRTHGQKLLLPPRMEAEFGSTGITFIPVEHSFNSQRSPEEAEKIKEIMENLLGCQFIDAQGNIKNLTTENILIVAPYNMQVNLLKKTLPQGARVGTVDKFQGQEAEVVFVSMTTSSQEDMPRHFDFLFSKNRLNVAISRAKTKAFLLCSPDLLRVNCNSIENMELVNVLCRAAVYGGKRIAVV